MTDKAAHGAGDIPINLAGEELVLKPTLEACMGISKLAGGVAHVRQKIGGLDFAVVCDVIALGLNATSGSQRKQIEGLVYREGLINVAGDCLRFIRAVSNGGVVPSDSSLEALHYELSALINRSGSDPELQEFLPTIVQLREQIADKLEREASQDGDRPLAEQSPSLSTTTSS